MIPAYMGDALRTHYEETGQHELAARQALSDAYVYSMPIATYLFKYGESIAPNRQVEFHPDKDSMIAKIFELNVGGNEREIGSLDADRIEILRRNSPQATQKLSSLSQLEQVQTVRGLVDADRAEFELITDEKGAIQGLKFFEKT